MLDTRLEVYEKCSYLYYHAPFYSSQQLSKYFLSKHYADATQKF
jgi:hypothetical protein